MTRDELGTSRRGIFQTAAAAAAATFLTPSGIASPQSSAGAVGAQSRRRAYLEEFLRIFPPGRTPPTGRITAQDKTWEDLVRRTGLLPPDFSSMPSIADLPDPLIMRMDGRDTPVRSAADWKKQKQWIREQVEHWVFGTMPPAPGNLRAVVTATRREGTVTARDVRLEFGPGHRATLRLELKIPDGKGPFPVFLTNHNWRRPWLYTAVKRGYIGCYYAAADPGLYGDVDDSDAYIDIYPEYEFSCLARWAWSASRAVDYLLTLPEVEKSHIGLTGHSRGGKQALLAAAFDERIGAVIPSSGNTGESDPWRYTTGLFVNETIELLTAAQPHWFHPRLRFFAGREDKLPVDQNSLMAMVAPRGLMLYSGYAESAGNPLGFEQAFQSARSVYRFLGGEENLWLTLREGEHATTPTDIEQFIDFFDTVFRRKRWPRVVSSIVGYSFDGWRRITGEQLDPLSYPKRRVGDFLTRADGKPMEASADWAAARPPLRDRIASFLGEPPPMAPFKAARKLSDRVMASEGWLATLYSRPADTPSLRDTGMGVAHVAFGDGLAGELFHPAAQERKPASGKWPVVVWLHPYSYQNGWSAEQPWNPGGWIYTQDQRPSFPLFVNAGFAVFAFDQIGFGTRIHEARAFYERYPKWSRLGNMLVDTRAAVNALAQLEEIEASRIYLLGYGLGGKVGLLTAAFEDGVRGVVSVCGADALRLNTAAKGGEGLRHYSHLHGLLPRLGDFIGNEERVPFDFDEVMALAAPKPMLVVAPALDRYVQAADVREEVEAARRAYALTGASAALTFETPEDINRFSHKTQQRALEWLRSA